MLDQLLLFLGGFSVLNLPLGYGHQMGKMVRLLNCHISQYLAVDFNPGPFQAIDELGISEPACSGGSVNP